MLSGTITGFVALVTGNNAPQWNATQTNFTIQRSLILNLSRYFVDNENETLAFAITQTQNLTATLEKDLLIIFAGGSFVETENITIIASDSISTTRQTITIIRLIDLAESISIKKIEEDLSFNTTILSKALTNESLLILFSHDSEFPQPVSVIGNVNASLSRSLAFQNEIIELKILLVNEKIPRFRLKVGAQSEILEFGLVQTDPDLEQKLLQKNQTEAIIIWQELPANLDDINAVINQRSSEKQEILSQITNYTIIEEFQSINALVTNITSDQLQELQNNIFVKQIIDNKAFNISLQDSIPLIRADLVHNTSLQVTNQTPLTYIKGSGQSICILDTGITKTHPAFAGRIIAEKDFVNNDNDAMDDNGHGTHVAGIIASNGDLKGVAPEANLAVMKVCDNTGTCFADSILSAIDYCTTNAQQLNISAISGSFGDGGNYDSNSCPTYFDDTLFLANQIRITNVFSSGNQFYQNGINYPACSPYSLSVGASTKNDQISDFSNIGPNLDVLAPGENINSTWLIDYAVLSGTSMAAPHTTGLVTLIQQHEKHNNRTITPQQIEDAIKQNGVNVDSHVRIDAYATIEAIKQTTPPSPSPTPSPTPQINQTEPPLFRTTDSISACNLTIDKDVDLSADISIAYGAVNCFAFNFSNIIFDCAGYTVNDPNRAFALHAFNITNFNNISIKNCRITNMFTAVLMVNASNNSIWNNSIDLITGDNIIINRSSNFNHIFNNTIRPEATASRDIIVILNSSSSNNITNNIINSTNAGRGLVLERSATETIFNSNTIQTGGTTIFANKSIRTNITHNLINSTSSSSPAILMDNSSEIMIINNTISTRGPGGSSLSHGISIQTNSFKINITGNTINTSMTNANGIIMMGNALNNTRINESSINDTVIINNTIHINGSSDDGIQLNGTFRVNISENNITLRNRPGAAIYLLDNNNDTVISNNTFHFINISSNFNGYGVIVNERNININITSNTFNTSYMDYAIYLRRNAKEITIADNNIINEGGIDLFADSINQTSLKDQPIKNYSIRNVTIFTVHNSSTGNITFLGNITIASGTVRVNFSNDIRIQSNSTFVNTTAQAGFNASANISLFSITLANPKIVFDDNDDGTFERCDSCNNLSFANNIFTFNTTRFTSYAVQNTTSCFDLLTADITFTENLTCPRTAFFINANDIFVDCAGFTIDGTGNGIALNSTNQNNLTIRNCVIEGNYTHPILFVNSSNNTIRNVSILANSTRNHAILINQSSNGNKIFNNSISIPAVDTIGVFISNNSVLNNITNNYFNVSGTRSNSIFLLTEVNDTIIINNTMEVFATNADAIILSTRISRTNITNNTIQSYRQGSQPLNITNDINDTLIDRNILTYNSTTGSNENDTVILLTRNIRRTDILENILVTNFTSGIILRENVNDTIIFNNSISTNVSLSSVVMGGILANDSINRINITQNFINMTDGTFSRGIEFDVEVHEGTIHNNTIEGRGGNQYSIVLTRNVTNTNITFNNVTTYGSSQVNIYVAGDINKTIISGNSLRSATKISTGTTGLIVLTARVFNTNISRNILDSNATRGIYLIHDINDTIIENNTIEVNNSNGIRVEGGVQRINITQNFINTTYSSGNGVVVIANITDIVFHNNTITVPSAPISVIFSDNITRLNFTNNNITAYGANAIPFGLTRYVNDSNIAYNWIKMESSSSEGAVIRLLTDVVRTNITQNVLEANDSIGIEITSGINDTIILNNSIFTNSSNPAIYVYTRVLRTNITQNYINITMGRGMIIQDANDTIIHNNTILSNSIGVSLSGGVFRTNITLNNITTSASGDIPGITVSTNINDTVVGNNLLDVASATSTGGIGVAGNAQRINVSQNAVTVRLGHGIFVSNSANITVLNNSINANGGGIRATASQALNISLNYINSTGTGNGIGLDAGTNFTDIIRNTIIMANASSDGIEINGNVQNTNITFNNITTRGTTSLGIFLTSTINFTDIHNNTILTFNSSSPGIGTLSTVVDMDIFNNTINSSQTISIDLFNAAGIMVRNNTLLRGTGTTDLRLYDTSRIILSDQPVANFSIWFSSRITKHNSTTGNITFTGAIGLAIGTNMNSQVQIANNLSKVDTVAVGGLNVSANITFINTTIESQQIIMDAEDDGSFLVCPTSICTTINLTNNLSFFQVTHFTTYAVNSTTAPVLIQKTPSFEAPPAPKPKMEMPKPPIRFNLPPYTAPVIRRELPKINGMVPISMETLEETNISCAYSPVEISDLNIIRTNLSPKISVPKNYELIEEPFTLNCKDEDINFTMNIPDNYQEIRVLKCSDGECRDADSVLNREGLICAGVPIEEIRKQEYKTKVFIPVEEGVFETNGTLTLNKNRVEKNEYAIDYLGDSRNIHIFFKLPTNLSLPENPHLMPGAPPFIVQITRASEEMPARITMPVRVPTDFDNSTLGIYTKLNDEWKYLGGRVDPLNYTVSAQIPDIKPYLNDDNEVVFGVFGTPCMGCAKASLEKIYNGTSDEAVVLVHGFLSTPVAWQPLIDDFVLNKQKQQVWVFKYPSNMTIETLGQELADHLEGIMGKVSSINLVGHSLGGLVIEEALSVPLMNKDYTFLKKVKKAIVLGTPHEGSPIAESYGTLFSRLINEKTLHSIFNINSALVQQLRTGKVINVPDMNYYAIAGTRSYDFTRKHFLINNTFAPNDGVVSIYSVQHLAGTRYINDKCKNYFEINLTHTEITDHPVPRRIVTRIINQEEAQKRAENPIVGYNSYIQFNMNQCSSNETILVIGKTLAEEKTPAPALCACGNNVCGIDETAETCPSDCAEKAPEEEYPMFLAKFEFCTKTKLVSQVLTVLLLILLLLGAVDFARHKTLEHTNIITMLMTLLVLISALVFQKECRQTLPFTYMILSFSILLLFAHIFIHIARKKPVIEKPEFLEPEITARKPSVVQIMAYQLLQNLRTCRELLKISWHALTGFEVEEKVELIEFRAKYERKLNAQIMILKKKIIDISRSLPSIKILLAELSLKFLHALFNLLKKVAAHISNFPPVFEQKIKKALIKISLKTRIIFAKTETPKRILIKIINSIESPSDLQKILMRLYYLGYSIKTIGEDLRKAKAPAHVVEKVESIKLHKEYMQEHQKLSQKFSVLEKLRNAWIEEGWSEELVEQVLENQAKELQKDADKSKVIINYAKIMLEQGIGLEKIKQTLINSGWPEKAVNKIELLQNKNSHANLRQKTGSIAKSKQFIADKKIPSR